MKRYRQDDDPVVQSTKRAETQERVLLDAIARRHRLAILKHIHARALMWTRMNLRTRTTVGVGVGIDDER